MTLGRGHVEGDPTSRCNPRFCAAADPSWPLRQSGWPLRGVEPAALVLHRDEGSLRLDVRAPPFHGGYPGAAPVADDFQRWRRYIIDSLIETTISRDVLLMTRVDKPALLRRFFELACSYSGQIISCQKMLGQLLDAGNTTTLAHYLDRKSTR